MRILRKLVTLGIACFLFLFGTIILLYSNYIKPVSENYEEKVIVIKKGLYNREIGKFLAENELIHDDDFLFRVYLRINNIGDLKPGTYKLSPSYSLKKIIEILANGEIYKDDTIRITFKEGINYRDLAHVIENNTSNSYDSVINLLNDEEYIDSLIKDYWFITDDIKNTNIYYPLEGYLFPDTYEFKNHDVTVPEIFKKLLDQMNTVLEPYKEKIENDEYSILASMAEKEVRDTDNYRENVVSVFVNRLNKKMALGSDITTRYGIKLDESRPLTKSEYNSTNPYNTRNSKMLGLPASPICMVSKKSIEVSINRVDTNYLYFIAHINTGETFFYEKASDFEKKKNELSKVNGGY